VKSHQVQFLLDHFNTSLSVSSNTQQPWHRRGHHHPIVTDAHIKELIYINLAELARTASRSPERFQLEALTLSPARSLEDF
jgi:hypothetical protein